MQKVEVGGQRAGICIANNQRSFLAGIRETFHYSKRGQLARINYRDVAAILLRERAADSKTSGRIIAHQPLSVKRFIDIQILGTSQAQTFDPLGREVERFLMQIRNSPGVEATRWGAD